MTPTDSPSPAGEEGRERLAAQLDRADHMLKAAGTRIEDTYALDRLQESLVEIEKVRSRLRTTTRGEAGSGEVAGREDDIEIVETAGAWHAVIDLGVAPCFKTRDFSRRVDAEVAADALRRRLTPTPAKDPAAHSEEGERNAWFVVRTMVNLAENGYEKAAAVAGRAALRARLHTTREPGGPDV